MKTFNEYMKEFKALIKDREDCAGRKKIKLAFLSSFNTTGFKEILYVQCRHRRIEPDVYVADYAQYNQEILNKTSRLYRHRPDVIILFIDTRAHLADYLFDAYDYTEKRRKAFIRSKLDELQDLIGILEKNTKATIIVHNLEVPAYSPMGIIENRQRFGLMESVEEFNGALTKRYMDDPRVYVYDLNSKISRLGKQNISDDKMYYIGDIKINLHAISGITSDYVAYIMGMLGLSKKCLVLDLDNTLWAGVLGEDGIEGIDLGPTPEGRPFWELQKYILSLFRRGVILAINSKNNKDDVLRLFREHPYAVLKEEHFASMQINWEDKVSNMKAIADELNIGVDSMVLLDDDKFNKEVMSQELPGVYLVDLPDDPALYLKTMQELDVFTVLQVTVEDRKKNLMYAQNRRRKKFEREAADIDKYLKGLRMKVKFLEPSAFTIPRMSQLSLKTNQWNMTTRRYQPKDIADMASDDSYLIRAMQVKDKFGDNGIVGLVIVKKQGGAWYIDTCLMSCRVIGRRLEEALIGNIINAARISGAEKVAGEFMPTAKNDPARDVYGNLGFLPEDGRWVYDARKGFCVPDFIQIER